MSKVKDFLVRNMDSKTFWTGIAGIAHAVATKNYGEAITCIMVMFARDTIASGGVALPKSGKTGY